MGRNKRLSDKKQIIDASFHIMDTEGVEALTMRRISTELGVSAMTPYNYVRDTKDIRREILIRSFNSIYQSTYAQMSSMLEEEGCTGLVAYAKAYAYTLYDFASEHCGVCSYLIGEGNRSFHNDVELGPFYDPFDIFLSELELGEKDREFRAVLRAYECMVLSLIHEYTAGLYELSKENYKYMIELFIKRMFIF